MRCLVAGRRRRPPSSATAASSTRSTSRSPERRPSLPDPRRSIPAASFSRDAAGPALATEPCMALAAARPGAFVKPSALPGFGPALGYTLVYLSLIVLLPLAALAWKASGLGFSGIMAIAADGRVLASLEVTFGLSFLAALVNVVFGVIVAWVLTRYD